VLKHHAMMTYAEIEVNLHTFLTGTLAAVVLPPEKEPFPPRLGGPKNRSGRGVPGPTGKNLNV